MLSIVAATVRADRFGGCSIPTAPFSAYPDRLVAAVW
jgi:hypothetical protein